VSIFSPLRRLCARVISRWDSLLEGAMRFTWMRIEEDCSSAILLDTHSRTIEDGNLSCFEPKNSSDMSYFTSFDPQRPLFDMAGAHRTLSSFAPLLS
jgi:hypothetical protein